MPKPKVFQINVWLRGSFLPSYTLCHKSFHLQHNHSAFSEEPVPHWASPGAPRRVAIPTSAWLSAGKGSTVDIATGQSSFSPAFQGQVLVTATEIKLLNRNEGSSQAPLVGTAPWHLPAMATGAYYSKAGYWLFSVCVPLPTTNWQGCPPALGVFSHPHIKGRQLTRKQMLCLSFGRQIQRETEESSCKHFRDVSQGNKKSVWAI